MVTRAPLDRTQRIEEIARRVSRLADCSIFIRSNDHFDELEEEADNISRSLKAVFRGKH